VGVVSQKAKAFVIGGISIRPGERRIVDLPVTDLSTHTPMTMSVQVICGRRSGPSLFVSAALHGDEISGVEIIRRVLKLSAMRRLHGTLIVVPIVNVFGFISLSRYLPDRRDLNRSFPGSQKGSLASRLANLFLSEVVAKCTHGIDLHTGAVHRANYPQIRANLDDPEAERMATSFGVPVVINASQRDGSLRQAAVERNVPVIVYEGGEALRFEELSIRAGVKGIVSVMRALEMLPASKRSTKVPRKPIIAQSSTWVRAPAGGILRATVALGSQVHEGASLGFVANSFGENELEVQAPCDGVLIGRTNLPVVNEGDGLFHIARVGGEHVQKALDAFTPEEEYERGLTAELADDPLLS
jgi:predicted deacylase